MFSFPVACAGCIVNIDLGATTKREYGIIEDSMSLLGTLSLQDYDTGF